MHDTTELLAVISKAPEDIQRQVAILSEPQALKPRETLANNITTLDSVLGSIDPVLEAIAMLAESESTLGLLWLATNAAYAELKRAQGLVKMVRLNLKPIPMPDGLSGMFRPPIEKAMAPAEERAIGSAVLTLVSDLSALVIRLQGVVYQLRAY
jgi:hypothetical protein